MRTTAALFFLTGLVSATWAARIPAIKEELGLSTGALGIAILGLEAGAIAGLPAGGALVARRGTRRVLAAGFAGYPLGLAAVGVAPGLAALTGALAAMAFANSLVDVAMNVEGVALERRAGRPLLARLHAGHAVGVLAGGALGTAAAAAAVPVATHFALTAAAAAVVGVAAARRLPGTAPAGPPRRRARWERSLALLGTVAFCAFLLDGAATAWIAVQLREAGAGPALAAAGFTAFAAALALGRLVADRLTARHGRTSVVRGGAAVAAGGVTAALLAPSAALAVAGWAVLGAGLAPLAPAVIAAAPEQSRGTAPAAIAAVTTLGYAGSFTGPPAIGAIAGVTGLAAALGLLVAVAVMAGLLAGPALRGRVGARAVEPRGVSRRSARWFRGR